MSTCTAAEIAEKKRIALEKLRAKKEQLAKTAVSGSKNAPKTCGNIGSMVATTGGGKSPLIKSNAVSPNTSNNLSNEKPSSSFYKSPTNTSNVRISSAADNENKASLFLSALKQSNIFANRLESRDSAHPYQRPMPPKGNSNEINLNQKPILGLNQTTKPLAPVFVNVVTCKIYMTSAKRFVVQPSSFHAKLIDVFKTIPSKAYDSNTHIWDFDIKDYDLVRQRVSGLNPDVVIGTIPKSVIYLCKGIQKKLDRSYLSMIEQSLSKKLLPFQQEGVCFAIGQHGRIMICDEMGLGKTYQALAIADYYKNNWPLLICTTASTRESWAKHVRELLPTIPVHYIQILNNNQQYFGDVKVLIVSYNMMEKHIMKLLERNFGVQIYDESHTLKNPKAKCTAAASALAKAARNVILLSGTPALSRPSELFTQLQLIDPKFMNFREFSSRYCDGKQTNFGWEATGQSNLEELNVVLKLKFMIRRTKADVLPEMVAKFRETVVLDPALVWLNDSSKEILNNVANNYLASKGREKEEILLRFYAQTAEVKTRAVCAYIKTLIKDKKKFIVFAHHRVMMDAISDCLFNAKVNFIRIDGSTKNEDRSEYIDTFQYDTSCQVAVLSLRACNAGITLTAAEMIIFAELDWNPSTLIQAESRAHRIGQDKVVTCRYLMATKTADDVIWSMLKAKQETLNRAGLFCDNLQEAVPTVAPTMSTKIDDYFSPGKSKTASTSGNMDSMLTVNSPKSTPNMPQTSSSLALNKNFDLSKELENLDEIFLDDDDDDAFKDLLF